MFLGEYHHNLDDKGRLAIPGIYRKTIGEWAVLTRGLDGCISIYPKKEWEEWALKLRALPVSSSQSRSFVRFQLGSAHEVKLDKQGRVLVPAPLRQYSEIHSHVVIAGVGERIEVWNKDKWMRLSAQVAKNAADIAEGIGI